MVLRWEIGLHEEEEKGDGVRLWVWLGALWQYNDTYFWVANVSGTLHILLGVQSVTVSRAGGG